MRGAGPINTLMLAYVFISHQFCTPRLAGDHFGRVALGCVRGRRGLAGVS